MTDLTPNDLSHLSDKEFNALCPQGYHAPGPAMTLSPAAQAVLTAQAKERCLFEWSAVNDPPCHPSDADWNGCIQCIDRRGLAAALRAAADQVVPEDLPTFVDGGRSSEEQWMARVESSVRQQLLAIAAELEGKGNG